MINATFPVDLVEVVVGGVDLGIEFSKLKWNHLLVSSTNSNFLALQSVEVDILLCSTLDRLLLES